jgi:glycosyltransferase involved in cell wall biosynthesis
MPFSMLHYWQRTIPVSIYVPAKVHAPAPTRAEGETFLDVFQQMLQRVPPDVLLTYGGHWLAREMIALARRRGIAVVFALHNFAYKNRRHFEQVDAVLVPSRFSAEYHQRTHGIQCTVIPSPINWDRIRCAPWPHGASVPAPAARQYVTFVNPDANKGVAVFARIAKELEARRPEIPLLIVEGRGGLEWLGTTGLDWSNVQNLSRMRNTPDPRDFYRASRIILMPSLWNESFGRVAAEAIINGIPVIASDRGALPETVGDCGVVLSIPRRYTPETRSPPTAAELAPWIEAVVRLWDDQAYYDRRRERCLARAQAWRPERIAVEHDRFFGSLRRAK